MGNCQAVDAAALVIQHPCGKLERLYWPVTASEVMKTNPGHYVSLIIPVSAAADGGGRGGEENSDGGKTVKFTRVKLLRPSDTLVLGRAYRLVATQEVMKVLRAKKHAKMNRKLSESGHFQMCSENQSSQMPVPDKNNEAMRCERHRQRTGSSNLGAGRPKSWRPSLQSISEAGT